MTSWVERSIRHSWSLLWGRWSCSSAAAPSDTQTSCFLTLSLSLYFPSLFRSPSVASLAWAAWRVLPCTISSLTIYIFMYSCEKRFYTTFFYLVASRAQRYLVRRVFLDLAVRKSTSWIRLLLLNLFIHLGFFFFFSCLLLIKFYFVRFISRYISYSW